MTLPVDVPVLDLHAEGDRRSQCVRVRLRIDGIDTVVCMTATSAVAAAMRLYEASKDALTDWRPDFGVTEAEKSGGG